MNQSFLPRLSHVARRPAVVLDVVLPRVLLRMATQDWLVGAYLMTLLVLVLLGHGPRQATALRMVVADSAAFWTCMVIGRSDLGRFRVLADLVYRVGLIGSVIATFLQLHYILPTVSHQLLDGAIYRLDLAVFGFEPSILFDRFVTPATTDWFSFFYYSYFFILSLFLIPMALFERRIRILSELSMGLVFVVCVGHTLYMVVPGRGPYEYLAPHFTHPLVGSFWWPLVAKTVASVDGALRTDIFPSLHTACPTFLTLFAYRNRAHAPYRYIWPVVAFFTSQIILATMFLRWHYLADICAGLTLATTAFVLSSRVVRAELATRRSRQLGAVWRPLFGTGGPAATDGGTDGGTDATPLPAPTEPCPAVVAGPDSCTAPLAPGQDRTCTFTFGGAQRKFLIYAPASYNPCAPTPLVIDAHGGAETAEMHAGLEAFKVWPKGLGSGWRVVADKEGFVVVTPQSINDFADETDIPFVLKVEEMASAIMNVDPAKIFMTGVSSGGFFSYTAACDARGSVFSGVSPVSGGNRSANWPFSKPASYIGFNAKTDEVVPYDNGVAGATLWEKTNHCKRGPTQTLTFGGPSTDTRELCLSSGPGPAPPFKLAACKASSSVSTCETWDGCDGDVKVTFCTVEGSKQLVGGHNLYFNDSKLSLAAVAWEFFKGTL